MTKKKESKKDDANDLLDGDAEQLRGKLKGILAQERKIAKLEKAWSDKRAELKEAHHAHDAAVLKLRELISGVPQSEMEFPDDSTANVE